MQFAKKKKILSIVLCQITLILIYRLKNIYEQYCKYNIFTIILSLQVFISSHLDPPLTTLYYLLFIIA